MLVPALAMVLCSAAGAQQVLWDNGGMVTHPGQGANGLDVSMAGPDQCNSAGSNARQVPAGDPHFRVADDFEVSGAWIIDEIVVHAYETNAENPGWTGANLEIWDGRPGDSGSSLITTISNFSVAQTDIYRVFNGDGNLNNTARRINAVTFDVGGLHLGAGEYWISWQVQGGGSGWAPPVMEPNPGDPTDTITVVDNGRHLSSTGWQYLMEDCGGTGQGVETPFIIRGSEGETCVGDLNNDGVVDVSDLLILLGAWGPNPGHPADLNDDGVVDVSDLLMLLGNWGECPAQPAQPGACCHADLTCDLLLEDDCIALGSDFRGPMSTCDQCPAPPDGEVCLDAIPVTIDGPPRLGDSTGHPIPDGLSPCGGVSPPSVGAVWFSVVGDGTQLTATTCGSGMDDTELMVFCDACASLSCITGADEGCDDPAGSPFQAEATWCAEAGTLYRIVVFGGGNTEGEVTLSVTSSGSTCTPAPIDCGDLQDPICAISEASCQERSGGTHIVSDSNWSTDGNRGADDFVAAESGQITSICWEGHFRTISPSGPCTPDDGGQPDFQITYYEDAGGIPGNVIASFVVTPDMVRIGWITFSGVQRGRYDFTADHPPVNVTAGQCYWIEIQGLSTGPCVFSWAPSDQGNRLSYFTSDPDVYTFDDVRHDGNANNPDRVFCVDLETGDPMECLVTTCCTPDDCIEGLTFGECDDLNGFWTVGQTCDPNPCITACCVGNDCFDDLTDTECADLGGVFVPGESCATAQCPDADYYYDLGTVTTAFGWADGGTYFWMNRYDVPGGGTDSLSEMMFTFGSDGGGGIDPGSPVGLAIYEQDGDSIGDLIWSDVINADPAWMYNGEFASIALPNIQVSGSFFIGAYAEMPVDAKGAGIGHPASIDRTVIPLPERSYRFGGLTGTPFGDINPAAMDPETLGDVGVGFEGAFLIRANGATAIYGGDPVQPARRR